MLGGTIRLALTPSGVKSVRVAVISWPSETVDAEQMARMIHSPVADSLREEFRQGSARLQDWLLDRTQREVRAADCRNLLGHGFAAAAAGRPVRRGAFIDARHQTRPFCDHAIYSVPSLAALLSVSANGNQILRSKGLCPSGAQNWTTQPERGYVLAVHSRS